MLACFIDSSGYLAMARLHFLHRIEKHRLTDTLANLCFSFVRNFSELLTDAGLCSLVLCSLVLVNSWLTLACVHWF